MDNGVNYAIQENHHSFYSVRFLDNYLWLYASNFDANICYRQANKHIITCSNLSAGSDFPANRNHSTYGNCPTHSH